MSKSVAVGILAMLAFTACGQTFEEKQAEALAAEPTIAPGIYSDVRMSGETGDLGGMELKLDQGSDSREIEFVFCEGWCNTVERSPVRRGLGGLSFALTYGEQQIDVTVQPAGADAVTVNVDFGGGMQQRRLRRVQEEFGLDVARNNQANLPG
jgi:hypothetical protein